MFGFKKKKDKEELINPKEAHNLNINYDDELSVLKHNQKCIVDKLDKKIEETGFATEDLININNKIGIYIENQMESIEKLVNDISSYSALAEEVAASTENSRHMTEETMATAQTGTEAVQDSIQAMNEIEESVKYAKEVVNELNTKAADINSMLNIIKDIADNTNLLSLNASIEAARAGEAGRGFAVVAQEVKKLSQRSVESVGQINKTINEINNRIKQTISAMDKSMERVSEGTKIAYNTMDVFKNIIDAVNTTSNVSEEINLAVSRQTENLGNVIASTQEMNDISEKVMSMIESASLNTQHTKTALNTLFYVSKDLKDISNKLLNKINDSKSKELYLKTCMDKAPLDYDPAMANDQQSAQILTNVYGGLLSIGNGDELAPGIAKSWSVEDDNLTWIFNIRKGAKFHNGREITADDVKYSYERLLSPSLKSPNNWFLEQIDGYDEYVNGRAKEVSGIKVIDRYRISIKLSSPYSGFLPNLAQFCCGIIAKEDASKGIITGCGPYIIESKDGERCILKAFKDYFGGCPYVDKIEIEFGGNASEGFLKNDYDFIMIDDRETLESLNRNSSNKIKKKSVLASYYAGFNLNGNSIFAKDKEVRKALNYAVNKEKIIHDILGGMAVESKGPFPPSMIENEYLKGFKYNPDLAKKILTERGVYRNSPRVKVLYRDESDDSLYNRITQSIIKDLKNIGIECVIEKIDPEIYLELEGTAKADIYVGRWIADTGDPDNFLQPLFNINNSMNFTRYNNEDVMEMMDRAKKIVNPQRKIEMYKEIENMIVDDAPWIFLYHPEIAYTSRKDVHGVLVNSLSILKYDDIIAES